MNLPKIIQLDEIKSIVQAADIFSVIEQGFVAYSNHQAVLASVSELLFAEPPGEVHVKSGYLQQDDYYVVKVASSFYENTKLALPSSNGLMLLFDKKFGTLLAIILDEGYLTDVRTAVAGTIAAKYLTPKKIDVIGIIGTGTQARFQLHYLQEVTTCKEVLVWGRNAANLIKYKDHFKGSTFNISVTQNITDITNQCNLIVTTTPAHDPLLTNQIIRKGTHITAVGADTPGKQELSNDILSQADFIIADSITQCAERGEIAHGINAKIISEANVLELGNVISNKNFLRKSEEDITIADLTGIAIQDLQMAKLVYQHFIAHT